MDATSGGVVMERSLTREVVMGTGAGHLASKVMDRVTTAYQERQSEESKQRERQVQETPAYVKAAEKLAQARGRYLDRVRADELGHRLHRALGLSGGLTAGFLAARGMNPVLAGLFTGLAMWLLVDEGANAAMGFTPPAPAYPPETHIRGLLGHAAYRAVLGGLLGVGSLLFARKRRSD
jgi:hypothetical protein